MRKRNHLVMRRTLSNKYIIIPLYRRRRCSIIITMIHMLTVPRLFLQRISVFSIIRSRVSSNGRKYNE